MSNQKLILAMCALAASLASWSARAEFIDETTPPKKVEVIVEGKLGSTQPTTAVGTQTAVQTALVTQFTVSRADRTIRETLVKWSKAAGWSFEAEHWALDRDIPVGGSKDLGTDFKAAVRVLVASTALSDRAARPCFYNNNVLRVIPRTERCSPEQ